MKLLRRLPTLPIFAALLSVAAPLSAADLILAREGKTEYQIVLPDAAPSPAIGEALQQAARLVQTAFKANGVDLPVVSEARRDAARAGIFLGDTAFARAQGIAAGQCRGWGYVHRVVGRDVIIAGHDQPAPIKSAAQNTRHRDWDRLGTVKGVADFLRQYAGTRFLYPDMAYRFMVGPQADAKWDAATGLIADAMDPRHAKDDPGWNGHWSYESRLESEPHRWVALIKIPFKTLGVETPAPGSFWRANFGRVHPIAPDQIERLVWSTLAGRPSMDDRGAFGEIVFEVIERTAP